jgi:NTP pyrophosphatase (non-canonical NTP hydrolase)
MDYITIEEYQGEATRTRNTDLDFNESIIQDILGLSGEIGEVIDEVKKIVYHGHQYDKKRLANELGDVLWYLSDTATTLGLSMNEIAITNIEKLKRRYPEGFESEKSINRKE